MKRQIFMTCALAFSMSAYANEVETVTVEVTVGDNETEQLVISPEQEEVVKCGECDVCVSAMKCDTKTLVHCCVCVRDEVIDEADFEVDEDSSEPIELAVADEEGNEVKLRLAVTK